MALAPGTRLGPYQISGPLGAGGMGEVYRAKDTRLGREVAIKILAGHRTDSPELRARFEREAKTVSSLNHPNICTLFDVGREGDTEYLVMELVDGETLAARIARGALPAADVLRIGAQVADALDRAHRAGVVHRDLKPANVMLTRSGAKLMDFGLARPAAAPAGGSGPTAPMPLTAEGTIVGTFQYMAPEQLEGKEADARADLWALGCVLYEMASGRRAFEGTSQASLIAAIMNADPRPLGELAPLSPAPLERLVHECLARDPEERRQSAHDLARELRAIGAESGSGARAVARPAGRSVALDRVLWAALAAIAAAIVTAALRGGGSVPAPHIVASIAPPPGTRLDLRSGAMVFSPDGRQIAFAAEDSAGITRLWVRPLDSPEARALPGSEGAVNPFWSPDGRSLGFFAAARLERIDLAGGSPQLLAVAERSRGGTWTRDGYILFSRNAVSPLMRIHATGGEPVPVARVPRSDSVHVQGWPQMLPDDRHFLVHSEGVRAGGPQDGIYVASIEPGDSARFILPGAAAATLGEPGRLYFLRGGVLWAQAFDARRFRLSGEPTRVADQVVFDPYLGGGLFAASRSGTIAYQQGPSAQLSELVWVDRAGRDIATVAAAASYYMPRLSHDGRRVAVDRSDPVTDIGDIWVYDLARGLGDRFTSEPENGTVPVWSPGDDRLFWMSGRGARGLADIHTRSLAGRDSEETLVRAEVFAFPFDCTPDGKFLLFGTRNGTIGEFGDLHILSLGDHKTSTWLATPYEEGRARLSPDGRWIAWASDESGQTEVYVQRFPSGGGKLRVSTAGGTTPVWRGDGREIFYVAQDRQLMSVAFQESPAPEPGTPVPLFRTKLRPTRVAAEYDVSADGRRFLINRLVRAPASAMITLEQGWRPPR